MYIMPQLKCLVKWKLEENRLLSINLLKSVIQAQAVPVADPGEGGGPGKRYPIDQIFLDFMQFLGTFNII